MVTIAAQHSIGSGALSAILRLTTKKERRWDRLVHQGVHLLERFAQDNRIRIPQPQQNLQIKVVRELPNANQFVAYVDAIGELDGSPLSDGLEDHDQLVIPKNQQGCCRSTLN